MQEESPPFMKNNMLLQEWLGVWTACTCSGRIALWPGKAGSQTGKAGKPTIVLEAFSDHNLWFLHHSLRWPGLLNDINIWNQSCLLKALLDGSFASDVDFEFTVGNKVFQLMLLAIPS
jgi:hypothetical protein